MTPDLAVRQARLAVHAGALVRVEANDWGVGPSCSEADPCPPCERVAAAILALVEWVETLGAREIHLAEELRWFDEAKKLAEQLTGVTAERDALALERDRVAADLDRLTDQTEPEPGSLHYDECPYKPFADLLERPEHAAECTCSMRHKAAYWKARWVLTKGWREIAESRLAALRAGLEEYGRHDFSCASQQGPNLDNTFAPCSCGLAALLREER